MVRRGAAAAGGVSGILLLVGAFGSGWWTGTISAAEARIGLRSLHLCVAQVCETDAIARVFAGHDGFVTLATVVWVACMLSAGLLLAGTALRALGASDHTLNAARWSAAASFVLSILCVASFPGVDVTVGWSFWVALAGALGGFVGASAALAPVKAPVYRAVEARRETSGPALLLARGSRSGADAAAASIRFAVKQLTIGVQGLDAEMLDGSRRTLLWSELGSMFVAQLPVDPPYEKRVFLDIIPRTGGAPLRLLSTTRANYDAIGGPLTTSVENFRLLMGHARTRTPGVAVDHVSRAFLLDHKAPRQFLALSQFTDYDSRFD